MSLRPLHIVFVSVFVTGISCVTFGAGCSAERLSVGELCQAPSCEHATAPLSPEGELGILGGGLGAQSTELSWAWALDLECDSDVQCQAEGLVLHDDGAMTVLLQAHGESRHGPVLYRVAATGEVLGMDDSLVRPSLSLGTLSSTAHGDALLARGLHTREGHRQLEVYRVTQSAEPELLFTDLGLSPHAVLEVDGDIVVLGVGATAGSDEGAIELRRYDGDGALVFRQNGLRKDFVTWTASTPHEQFRLQMAASADGGVYAVTQGAGGGTAGLARVDADGTVAWHMESWLSSDVRLELDTAGDPLLVGMMDESLSTRVIGLSGGAGGYSLLRIDPADPERVMDWATRPRSEYYDATPEALTAGPDGLVHVATVGGVLSERTLFIDRVRSDLRQATPLELPPPHRDELTELDGALVTAGGTTFVGTVRGMKASPDGALFVLMDGSVPTDLSGLRQRSTLGRVE